MHPALQTSRNRLKLAYLYARRSLSGTLIERRRGIETSREVNLEALGLAGAGRVRYEPSGWLDLRRILPPGELGPDDVFVDLGSGKGRVVLQAARHPVKRVVGVELSEELNSVARHNLEASRPRLRCQDVRLVTTDVLDWDVPDDVTVVYIYNAFRGELFDAVLERLLASLDRNPRRMRLMYRTPLEEHRLLATGRARLVRSARGLRPGRAWSRKMSIRMYELEPAPAAAERSRVTA